MEMTDMAGQQTQRPGSSENMLSDNQGAVRRISVQRAAGNALQHQGSLSNVDGFEDFEEFVLDFDDYDLLESIHSQLESPLDPARKLSWDVLVSLEVQPLPCDSQTSCSFTFNWSTTLKKIKILLKRKKMLPALHLKFSNKVKAVLRGRVGDDS